MAGETPYFVSVIIDNYNYGRFLRTAVDSALTQTYDHVEVIVVDDGSTDDSREIIASYGSRIIPVLKPNGGQASAFDAGLQISCGSIICFLDADDALFPTVIEEVVRCFRAVPDLVKVHWPLLGIDAYGEETGVITPRDELPRGDLRDFIVEQGPGNQLWTPTSGNAFARWFIEKIFPIIDIRRDVSTFLDLYVCSLAPLFGPIERIVQPHGLYRMHGENDSARGSFDYWLHRELARWEHCFDVATQCCRIMDIAIDRRTWERNSWCHRLRSVAQEIEKIVPQGDRFILVDEDQLEFRKGGNEQNMMPFLERDGQYWGRPADDETAIYELERLRKAGATYIAFAWPAFWWLDFYSGFRDYLRSTFACVHENALLVIFDFQAGPHAFLDGTTNKQPPVFDLRGDRCIADS